MVRCPLLFMPQKIPYFIEVRGCINCDVSKQFKERTGNDYGFDHEIIIGCIIKECVDYGFSLPNPFLDPEEGIQRAKASGNPVFVKNARIYCKKVNERFGKFYEMEGISLTELL